MELPTVFTSLEASTESGHIQLWKIHSSGGTERSPGISSRTGLVRGAAAAAETRLTSDLVSRGKTAPLDRSDTELSTREALRPGGVRGVHDTDPEK